MVRGKWPLPIKVVWVYWAIKAKGIIEGKETINGLAGIKINIFSPWSKKDKADKGESENEEEHNDEPDF